MSRSASSGGPGRRELRGAVRVFAQLGFPLSLAGSVALTLALMGRGVDPALAIGPPIALFFLLIAVAERIVPWHESWLHPRGDLRTDVALFFTNTAVNVLIVPLALAAATAGGALLSSRLGLGLWPGDAPLLLQLPLALVVAELWEYSFHRSLHEVPWLWRFHATHHGAPRLYWLNAVRFHPVDLFFVGALKLVPLALLGADAPVFALVNVVSAVHGSYQHANVPVRIGPLNWIFSMTELHRWHHSRALAEANHNYGGNLIVWDVVFGTRWLPADREPPEEIGIAALPGFPTGFLANLAAPFRWRRVEIESAQPAAIRR